MIRDSCFSSLPQLWMRCPRSLPPRETGSSPPDELPAAAGVTVSGTRTVPQPITQLVSTLDLPSAASAQPMTHEADQTNILEWAHARHLWRVPTADDDHSWLCRGRAPYRPAIVGGASRSSSAGSEIDPTWTCGDAYRASIPRAPFIEYSTYSTLAYCCCSPLVSCPASPAHFPAWTLCWLISVDTCLAHQGSCRPPF